MEQRVVEAGDTAPKFYDQDRRTGSRSAGRSFPGKLLMVNFWATWCPPCVEEMPSLNQFAQAMAPQGVVVSGSASTGTRRPIASSCSRTSLQFQVARDPEENISSSYGTFKWPETYVINREGKVVQKYIGPRDWNDPQIVNSIRALL